MDEKKGKPRLVDEGLGMGRFAVLAQPGAVLILGLPRLSYNDKQTALAAGDFFLRVDPKGAEGGVNQIGRR